jgi:hypothetical protein
VDLLVESLPPASGAKVPSACAAARVG